MNEAEQLRASYRLVFGSEDGPTVIDDLERRFHSHTSTFSPDSHETAFREGQRSVVLFIKNMLIDQSIINKLLEGYEDNV